MSTQLPDAEALFAALVAQMKPIVTTQTALVGIHSGGVWLMERLLSMLGNQIPHGSLDISFYRDDFQQRGLSASNRPSQIDFDVQGRHIILIDDVFYTGRTIRAAMNELFDYGRPASISLAVLVNRGGRELPIVPQMCATDLTISHDKNLQLLRENDGRFYLKLEERH